MVATVRVTRRLLESLTGTGQTRPREGGDRQIQGGSGQAAPTNQGPRWQRATFPAVESSALTETVQYGNLLLKHEGEELAKVHRLADDLLSKHSPTPPSPCLQERQACFDCYRENRGNPAACSKRVQDYKACWDSSAV
mmetsp:Transcript_13987/g.36077  ORF Transcript_13987/g.36077 Transcript_13987/m.36077 type:complete len:138 (+) Transcript_13987:216-629(+)